MKRLLIFTAGLALCGCAATKGSITYPDGSKLDFSSYRWLWHTEEFGMTVSTNRTLSAKVIKTYPDAAAIQAVAEGVATGLAKGTVQGVK